MPNFQRSTWTAIFSVGLLAPIVVVLLLTLMSPGKGSGVRPGGDAATQAATASGPAPADGAGGAEVSPPGRVAMSLFAAGDERTLWVAHPVATDAEGKKIAAFQLLSRASNTGTWSLVRDGKGDPYFQNYPRGLATVSPPLGVKARATAYVFLEAGGVECFSANSSEVKDRLPPEHELLAETGSLKGVFALTAGPADASTTRPGDTLNLLRRRDKTAGTRPAAATQAAAGARNGPATSASRPAAEMLVNAYWFRDSHWTMLPALGAMGAAGGEAAPTKGSHVALALAGDRLVAFWAEPGKGNELVARTLDYHGTAGWSAAVRSALPETMPANSRLLPIVLDEALYLFWPAAAATGNTLELHGGRMGVNFELPAKNFLPVLSLKGAGDGLNPGTDVAIAPAENSIGVAVNTKTGALSFFVFNARGELTSGPSAVEPQAPRRDVGVAQNITMVLLVLMLTLSFWQWRQRPGALKLPAGMMIARPGARAGAFLIDFAIPYVLVCTFAGLWENDGYVNLISTAGKSILNFDVLFGDPHLLALLGIYLVHVTIGELFFRRSIGKAVMGLQVIMIDGKPPTLAATLVRNLIRLPELMLGILVIYLFISPHRQRLGDLVARTLVISPKPPGDGDAAPPGDAEDE